VGKTVVTNIRVNAVCKHLSGGTEENQPHDIWSLRQDSTRDVPNAEEWPSPESKVLLLSFHMMSV
jgi:hypothetical protein